MCRSPIVSFVYERGWRQNFESSGFPGPDEEVIFLCWFSCKILLDHHPGMSNKLLFEKMCRNSEIVTKLKSLKDIQNI
jgi:hypothetical protein